MPVSLASGFVVGASLYAAVGLIFAIAFVAFGLPKIDAAAQRPPFGFRLLLIPGSAAFWPLLLLRWLRSSPPPTEVNAHRAATEQIVAKQ